MSDLAWNIWGVIGGILFALIPAVFMWIRARLPSRNLPYLVDILRETQGLFLTAIQEGLLTDAKEFNQLKLNIWYATLQVDDIRAQVYDCNTWTDDVKIWWEGTSGTIFTLYYELNKTRVTLVKATSNGRRLRVSQGLIPLLADDKDPLGPSVDTSAVLTATPHSPAPKCASVPSEIHPTPQVTEPLQQADDRDTSSDLQRSRKDPENTSVAQLPPCVVDLPPLTESRQCATQATLSHDDLRDLLSLALCHPLPSADAGKQERAMRREVLLRFGRQLCGSDRVSGIAKGTTELERYTECDRHEALWRLAGRAPAELSPSWKVDVAVDHVGPAPLDLGPPTLPSVARSADNSV